MFTKDPVANILFSSYLQLQATIAGKPKEFFFLESESSQIKNVHECTTADGKSNNPGQ